MARSEDYDSAGSQFFIMLGEAEYLDGEYAAFGKVIDGKDNINRIVKNEGISDPNSGKLTHNLTIKKTIIDLKEKSILMLRRLMRNSLNRNYLSSGKIL